jgi:hypothetical protein
MIARVLVTGSRGWDDDHYIATVLAEIKATEFFADAVLVHGAAKGVDTIAAEAWRDLGGRVEAVPAKWGGCVDRCPPGHRKSKGGRSWCPTAGHRRNADMVARGADLCLAFHRGNSSGTADCIRRAHAAGIAVRVFDYDARGTALEGTGVPVLRDGGAP